MTLVLRDLEDADLGSAAVLARAGFVKIGSETSFADGLGREVVEHVYRLAGG